MPAKVSTVIVNIVKGEYDDSLDGLSDAIRGRKDALKQALFYELKVGDRVRIKDCNPKCLIGCVGTVKRKLQKRVSVDLDNPVGTGFRTWHKNIRVPMSMLTKVA